MRITPKFPCIGYCGGATGHEPSQDQTTNTMATLKLASFNVENLFSRAKILNLVNKQLSEQLLDKVADLNTLLAKDPYTAADKAAIKKLIGELKLYITIREDRGKLLNRSGAVTAPGAKAWDGGIEFKRDTFNDTTRGNTAQVIKDVDADVCCVIEAEDRISLSRFNSALLDSKKFKQVWCIDGNDDRGVVVGLLSNFEATALHSHIYDGTSRSRTFSRDCLHVELDLGGGKTLHALCNHLKSKMGGDSPASKARRKKQAERIAEILGQFNLKQDLVAVMGDMNDTPDSAPLAPLMAVADMHDVLELAFGNDMTKRWTYEYRGKKEQIDLILVSKPLKDAFTGADVDRSGMFGVGAQAASDHGAVWATFDL